MEVNKKYFLIHRVVKVLVVCSHRQTRWFNLSYSYSYEYRLEFSVVTLRNIFSAKNSFKQNILAN